MFQNHLGIYKLFSAVKFSIMVSIFLRRKNMPKEYSTKFKTEVIRRYQSGESILGCI